MTVLSPNANGQVILPAKARKELGVDKNTLLMCEIVNGSFVYTPIQKIIPQKKQSPPKKQQTKKKKYTYEDFKKNCIIDDPNISKTLSQDIDKILYS